MHRTDMLQRLRAETVPWDVLVIGGGATGLGTAVDAAARGYRTAVIEQADFAQATSSRSTKLIHGGIRYLQQGRVALVRESLRERGRLLRNAPHLVRPLTFILPNYEWWERPFYGAGLKIYDRLAGELGLGDSQFLSRSATLERLPTLQPSGLRGGIQFHDAQFDDARLAVALARTIADLHGVAVNYVKATTLLKQNGRIAGVIARDVESGEELELRARVVINATGAFADEIRRLDDREARAIITASQGAHIVLDKSFLPGDCALIVPRTADGRVFFVIPWRDRVLVGTTETPVEQVAMEPRPLREEIEFLLQHAGKHLSKAPQPGDVLSAFAGLRPLVRRHGIKPTSALPRSHAIDISPSGLITITGGKWTTYRQMAEDAVNAVVSVGGFTAHSPTTATLRLHGWCEPSEHSAEFAGHGSDANAVRALCEAVPGGGELLHPRLPYRAGEALWAARHEMARTVEDVLARRTRALFLDARASIEAAPRVARLMASALGLDANWEKQQVAAFQQLAQGYLCS